MKDREAFLDDMITSYEASMESELSSHDPIFHAFNAVANVADVISIYTDKEAREKYILTAKRRNSVIAHAVGYGYTPAFVEPDRHKILYTFSDATPESIVIPKMSQIRTEIEGDEYILSEVLNDVTVPAGSLSVELEVEVGETVDIFIGDGKGIEEAFPLEGDRVYKDSLRLRIETPLGEETWTQVEDFLGSEEGDNHFIVEVGAKNFNDMMRANDLMLYIRCGDGVSGRLFPDNSEIYAVYRDVNPNQDTLPLGVLTVMEDEIDYVDSVINIEVTKEKVLPEDIETIRRNAIYHKSIGNSMDTKEDFERAAIVQSGNMLYKAYAEARIENNQNIYTIYVSGDRTTELTQVYLDSIRDLMYENYAHSLNDVYELRVAPEQEEPMDISIMFEPDTLETTKEEIKTKIMDIIQTEVFYLELGQAYKIPVLWGSIVGEAKTTLKGLAYVQINTLPPTVAYNAELKIPDSLFTFTEIS